MPLVELAHVLEAEPAVQALRFGARAQDGGDGRFDQRARQRGRVSVPSSRRDRRDAEDPDCHGASVAHRRCDRVAADPAGEHAHPFVGEDRRWMDGAGLDRRGVHAEAS
jgi:hypothetical protein